MMETKSVEMTTRIEDALGGNGPRGDAISGWHIKAFMITSRALFGDDLWQIKETRRTSKKPFLGDDASHLTFVLREAWSENAFGMDVIWDRVNTYRLPELPNTLEALIRLKDECTKSTHSAVFCAGWLGARATTHTTRALPRNHAHTPHTPRTPRTYPAHSRTRHAHPRTRLAHIAHTLAYQELLCHMSHGPNYVENPSKTAPISILKRERSRGSWKGILGSRLPKTAHKVHSVMNLGPIWQILTRMDLFVHENCAKKVVNPIDEEAWIADLDVKYPMATIH
ncbi:hypothetical protein BJ912DRAFT_1048983 [Pholiota molesta]|nr:hypothetical protein BJ912DRAFT_1048983 [Pholiota molesta]